MPVQRVCRPDHTFRGFQGQIEAGSISAGDLITVLPQDLTDEPEEPADAPASEAPAESTQEKEPKKTNKASKDPKKA